MGENTVTLNLAAATKAGTKAAFQSIADGFKTLGKEVRATAKDLMKAGKTGAADSMGHLAMAIDRVSNSSKEFAKSGKDTRDSIKGTTASLKDYSGELQVVQKAFAQWSNNGKATGAALQVAQRDTDALAKSIASMGVIMNRGGASWEAIDKWKASLSFDKISKGMDTGYLKATATGFQDISKAGMAFLGVNKELVKSFSDGSGFVKKYQDVLRDGAKISTRYSEAVKTLGNVIGKTDDQTSRWAPALKKVHTTMETTRASIGKSANMMNHWSHTTKMASVAQAVLAGDVKATTSGFQIMNEKGLKAFNGLTITAADKLGILSKSFDNLSVKTGAQSITAYGKAVNDSIGKTDKFSKGIQTLAGKYGVMSASFRSNYEDMKRSDSIWNKHVTTLQKTGQISEKTAASMRNGFNAVKVSADQLSTSLARPNKQYAELSKTIDRVSVATGKSTTVIRQQADALKASGQSHSQVINSLNSSIGAHREYSKVQDQIKGRERELAGLRKVSVNSIRAVSDAIMKGATSEQQLIKVATIRNQNLKDQITSEKAVIASRGRMEAASIRLAGKYKQEILANKEFQTALNNTVKAYGVSANAGKAAELQLNNMNKALLAAQKPATMFGKALASVGDHIKSFASYATAASFIAGLVGSFTAGVTAVVEFDQALKDLQAITGATDREVALMGETIKHVASTTKFSATEVADGMKTLGQAGFSAKEAIETIGAVSDLATGTLSDMSTSVDLVTTAMRVFSIESYDSGRVADVFANAVNKSKLTIDKLRVAFNYVGPVAVAAGASFEEVNSAMMTLANSGMRASTIGTGLRQILSGLVKPSEAFAEGVQKAGMRMEDFNLKSNSMSTVIKNLRFVVTDAEDAFKMFGLRAATAVTALTATNANAFDKMQAAVGKTGTAAAMAAKQMEGLGVRIKNMWDKSKNLAIALGETGLSGVLGTAVDGARGLLDILTALVGNPISGFIVKVGIATTTLLALTMAVRGLAATKLGLWFTGAAGAVSGFTASVNGATAALGRFLLNPLVLAMVGLGVAVAGTMYALNKWQNSAIDAFDKAKNLSEGLETLQAKMDAYQSKVANLSESSDEFKEANLKLRGELEEVSKRMDDLGVFAKAAQLSINALDGTFLDGGESVRKYQEELERFSKVSFREATIAADAAIKKSLDNGIVWFNNLKNGASQYFGAMGGFIKTAFLNMGRDAEESSQAWAKLKRDVDSAKSSHQKLNEVIAKFKNGTATYKELKTVLMDNEVAATALGKALLEGFAAGEEQVSQAITELVKLGKIDMNMTEQEILAIAKALGIIPEEAEEAIKIFQHLIGVMKDASGDDIDSFAAQWASEIGTATADYDKYINEAIQNNSKLLGSFDQLNAEVIRGFEERKRRIAEAQIASDKLYAEDKNVENQVKRNDELKRMSKELNKAMEDDETMSRYRQLQTLEKSHAERIAEINIYREKVSPKTYHTQMLAAEQKFQHDRGVIMGEIFNPEQIKQNYEELKRAEEAKLDERLDLQKRKLALGETAEADYHRSVLAMNLDAKNKLVQIAKDQVNALKQDGSKDQRKAAMDELIQAETNYARAQTESIVEVGAARDAAMEAEKTAMAELVTLEQQYADDKVAIEKEAIDKINKLPKSKYNRRNIAEIKADADAELRERTKVFNAESQQIKSTIALEQEKQRNLQKTSDMLDIPVKKQDAIVAAAKKVTTAISYPAMGAPLEKVNGVWVQMDKSVKAYGESVKGVKNETDGAVDGTKSMAENLEVAKGKADALSNADITAGIDEYAATLDKIAKTDLSDKELLDIGKSRTELSEFQQDLDNVEGPDLASDMETQFLQIDRELTASIAAMNNKEKVQLFEDEPFAKIDAELTEFFADLDKREKPSVIDEAAAGKSLEEIKGKYGDLNSEISKNPIQVLMELNQSAYNKVKSAIDKLAKTKITIPITYKETNSSRGTRKYSGGQVKGMSGGGRIGGMLGFSSNRDTELIKARRGEWFTRNEAADYWGDGIMSGITEPFSKMGRAVASMFEQSQMQRRNVSAGIQLRSSSQSDIVNAMQSFGTVNLNLPTDGPAIPVMMNKNDIGMFLSQLKTMGRLSS